MTMKKIIPWLPALLLVAGSIQVQAQICLNSADSVYGLNSITGSGSGQIVSINVNNAGAALVGSPAAASANANGVGFSQITGLFYFFNHIGNSDFTEFVSYNPVSGSKVAKAIPSGPALPLGTTGKIRTGTGTRDGSGYYMIFPGATVAMGYPVTNPAFYYYNIALDTWTLITQSFVDALGNNVAPIKTLNSGDMAFDGSDNLWILASNSTQYALYRIKAPLPVAATASVTVDTIVPVTANPISGVSFTGIAFNSEGKMYLSTGSCTTPPCAVQYNKLYEMATPGVLTLVGTLPVNGYGDDLTSCVYPPGVLATLWINFSATLTKNAVSLTWKVNENGSTESYTVEYSMDGEHWQTIANIAKDNSTTDNLKVYHYSHYEYADGNNHYRIVQHSASGAKSTSPTKIVNTRTANRLYIGPNPARDVLYLYNKDNSSKLLAQFFDKNGQLVWSTVVAAEQQSLNISNLTKGSYVLRLVSPAKNEKNEGFHFIKW